MGLVTEAIGTFLDRPWLWIPVVMVIQGWSFVSLVGWNGLRYYWINYIIGVVFEMLRLLIYYRILSVGYWLGADAWNSWSKDVPRTLSVRQVLTERPQNRRYRWFLNALVVIGAILYLVYLVRAYEAQKQYEASLFPLQQWDDLFTEGITPFSL